MIYVDLLVNGVVYEASTTPEYAYYSYVDSFGLVWRASRKTNGGDAELWQAGVFDSQDENRSMVLLRESDVFGILEGLSELIKLSDWLRKNSNADVRELPKGQSDEGGL